MIPWFKKYDIKVRALVMAKAKVLIVTLKDTKNNCVLDFSKHKFPPNYTNKGALEKWVTRRINDFLADCRNIGLEVEYITATNAGFPTRMIEKFRQRKKKGK